MEFDITGTLRPQLAKAMPDVSKDNLVYTFDLRDDVLFQDGTPLTSEDVKYSIEYTINPANKASRGPIFNRLSHVETDGPHRVHVYLKEPFAPWLMFLTKHMGVWPKDSRDKLGNDYFRLTPKAWAPAQEFSRNGNRTTTSVSRVIRITGRTACRTGTGWW